VLDLFDYKTGRQQHTDDVLDNPQMLLCAIAASRAFGVEPVHSGLAYVEDSGIWRDEATIDGFSLDAFEEELRDWVKENSNGPTPPVPGPHCTRDFCPLRGECAATREALVQITTPFALALDDDAEALRVHRLIPLAEEALKKVKEARDERAKRSPIPLENGHYFGQVEKVEERIPALDEDDVEAMREYLPTEVFAETVVTKTTASKTAMGDAMAAVVRARAEAEGRKPKRGEIGAAKEALFATLRANGLLREGRYWRLEELEKKDDDGEAA
jgi:hypothetical protein